MSTINTFTVKNGRRGAMRCTCMIGDGGASWSSSCCKSVHSLKSTTITAEETRKRTMTTTATTTCIRPTRRIFSISFLSALLYSCLLAWYPLLADASVLHKFVDVKGNGAFREVRIMYDLYHSNGNTDGQLANVVVNADQSKGQSQPSSAGTITGSAGLYQQNEDQVGFRAYEVNVPLYPWSIQRPHVQHPTSVHLAAHHSSPAHGAAGPNDSLVSGQYHPQYYLEQGVTRPGTRYPILYSRNIASHHLVRGKPLFVEVDFVPKYIPQTTYFVALSVTLPAHIRGRPWILGWHQEVFPIPTCRLCTNHNQSFTLPVTLFLPDDGWCPEGRVQSIWKIEAIPREGNSRVMDQTDMILAYGYDDLRQLYISNDSNTTVHCRGISEAIVA